MSCCGGKRAALREQREPAVRSQTPRQTSVEAIPLRLKDAGSLVARGEVTGTAYTFVRGQSVAVDRRDVAGLLRTGRFV